MRALSVVEAQAYEYLLNALELSFPEMPCGLILLDYEHNVFHHFTRPLTPKPKGPQPKPSHALATAIKDRCQHDQKFRDDIQVTRPWLENIIETSVPEHLQEDVRDLLEYIAVASGRLRPANFGQVACHLMSCLPMPTFGFLSGAFLARHNGVGRIELGRQLEILKGQPAEAVNTQRRSSNQAARSIKMPANQRSWRGPEGEEAGRLVVELANKNEIEAFYYLAPDYENFEFRKKGLGAVYYALFASYVLPGTDFRHFRYLACPLHIYGDFRGILFAHAQPGHLDASQTLLQIKKTAEDFLGQMALDRVLRAYLEDRQRQGSAERPVLRYLPLFQNAMLVVVTQDENVREAYGRVLNQPMDPPPGPPWQTLQSVNVRSVCTLTYSRVSEAGDVYQRDPQEFDSQARKEAERLILPPQHVGVLSTPTTVLLPHVSQYYEQCGFPLRIGLRLFHGDHRVDVFYSGAESDSKKLGQRAWNLFLPLFQIHRSLEELQDAMDEASRQDEIDTTELYGNTRFKVCVVGDRKHVDGVLPLLQKCLSSGKEVVFAVLNPCGSYAEWKKDGEPGDLVFPSFQAATEIQQARRKSQVDKKSGATSPDFLPFVAGAGGTSWTVDLEHQMGYLTEKACNEVFIKKARDAFLKKRRQDIRKIRERPVKYVIVSNNPMLQKLDEWCLSNDCCRPLVPGEPEFDDAVILYSEAWNPAVATESPVTTDFVPAGPVVMIRKFWPWLDHDVYEGARFRGRQGEFRRLVGFLAYCWHPMNKGKNLADLLSTYHGSGRPPDWASKIIPLLRRCSLCDLFQDERSAVGLPDRGGASLKKYFVNRQVIGQLKLLDHETPAHAG
jgi:hypothetical protein